MSVNDRLVGALAGFAPGLVTLALVGHFWTAGPLAFVPTWNDEIIYWTEIASFAEAGFNTGYFTIHEQPARLTWSPFGAHGPLFPAIVGTVATVFGWQVYSGFVFNLVVITLAAATWAATTRDRIPTAIAALFLASFWPIAFYLPSNMQEPLHFAIALLFGALLPRLSRSASLSVLASCVALLVVASLLRPTWALMSIPILWMRLRSARPLAIVIGIGITAAAYFAFNWLAAPFPNALNALIANAPTAPAAAVRDTALRTFSNVQRYFSFENATTAEVFLRYEVVVVLASCAILAWRRRDVRGVTAIAILTLGPAVAAVLVAGWVESWRDFRAVAPALLVALLVAGAERPSWLRIAGVANVVVALIVIPAFLELHEPRFPRRDARIQQFAAAVSPHLVFRRDAPRWDDTVLMHVDLLQHPALGLPPGIGLSFVLDWEAQRLPPRSRYLLLRREEAEQLRSRIEMVPLADTVLGTLYLNESAERARTAVDQPPATRPITNHTP